MFKWINKRTVQSSRGFSVVGVSRFEVEYQEEGKKRGIYTEPAGIGENGNPREKIPVDAFSQWDYPQGLAISKHKQKELMKNFIEAMAFMGVEVLIDVGMKNDDDDRFFEEFDRAHGLDPSSLGVLHGTKEERRVDIHPSLPDSAQENPTTFVANKKYFWWDKLIKKLRCQFFWRE